jgi:hypothetical protein
MKNTRLLKGFIACLVICGSAITSRAFPDYLKKYAADPSSKPELQKSCSVCHTNPAGGGERNEFGKAFAANGMKITDALRQQFPDKFLSQGASDLPVTFVQGSDSQAMIEINGKKFLIDTKTKIVKEMTSSSEVAKVEPPKPLAKTSPTPAPVDDKVYQQMDVRLIGLPTAKPIEKGALYGEFTHRFPFGDYKTNEISGLFGLDGYAVPSFGFVYGITDRIQVGASRSPDVVGKAIQLSAGVSLLDENKGKPFSAMARIGIEGRDNFRRNFTTNLELTIARSLTNRAQIYFVPTVSFNNRPFGQTNQDLPGATTYAMGVGGALNIRPTVALMAEANWRLNDKGKFGSSAPAFGFGIEKATISRKHAFSLLFTTGAGTTMSQRSATRRSLVPGSDESLSGLTIGFNISRRMF